MITSKSSLTKTLMLPVMALLAVLLAAVCFMGWHSKWHLDIRKQSLEERFLKSEIQLTQTAELYLANGPAWSHSSIPVGVFRGQPEVLEKKAFLLVTAHEISDCGLLYVRDAADFPEYIHSEQIHYRKSLSSTWWRVCYSW